MKDGIRRSSLKKNEEEFKEQPKKINLDHILAGIDKLGDEITSKFGYNNDSATKIETIASDFDGFENFPKVEGEHLVYKLDLFMEPKHLRERMDKMKLDLYEELYTEDQLSDYYKIRE